MQVKDLDDTLFLTVVRDIGQAFAQRLASKNGLPVESYARWAMRWDLERCYPDVPPRVILAKCRTLIRRDLLDGCTCGCRGDFELTQKGLAFLAG